jgi:hypothetical protein
MTQKVTKKELEKRLEFIESELEKISISHKLLMDQFAGELKTRKVEYYSIMALTICGITTLLLTIANIIGLL